MKKNDVEILIAVGDMFMKTPLGARRPEINIVVDVTDACTTIVNFYDGSVSEFVLKGTSMWFDVRSWFGIGYVLIRNGVEMR
jgi:hypothetical protein